MRPPHYCKDSILYPVNSTSDFSIVTATNVPELFTTSYYNETDEPELRSGGIATQDLIGIIIYSIVFMLATVGNSLVIATLVMNKRMGTVTNYFLLSLAVSDLMVAIVCIPLTLIGRLKQEFIFGVVMCKTMAYLMGVSVCVSTFTMVAISLERYYAICSPLRARRWQTKSHACKVIAGIWTISFLLMVPLAVYNEVFDIPVVKLGKCRKGCRIRFPGDPNEPARNNAWYVFQLIVLLCIPGLLMSVAYGCICRKIYGGFRFHDEGAQKTEMKKLTSTERKKNDSNGKVLASEKFTLTTSCETSRRSPSPSPHGENGAVATKSHKKRLNGTSDTPSDTSRRNETKKQLDAKKKVVEMLIVIVFFFFVCWTPTFVANVWKSFDPRRAMKSLQGAPIITIQILRYVSTCVNPVVYCFLNKRFRRAFLNIFCICCSCLPDKCRPNTGEASQQLATHTTLTTNAYAVSTTSHQ